MAVPRVGGEAERCPERRAAGGGVDRHRTTRLGRPFEQRRGKPATDPAAAKPLSDIKPPHPQGPGNGWVYRQATDGRELVIEMPGMERFAGPIEPQRAGRPIGGESVEMPIPLGLRFRSQRLKPGRQSLGDLL